MGQKSKIDRLPTALRNELGERYLNGADFPELAEWINNEPEAIKRWTLHFPENPKLTSDNFSCWKRDGGFARWKEEWATIQLSERCMKIANASGGNITRGAAAILAGKLLVGIENTTADMEEFASDEEGAKQAVSYEDKLVKLAMALKMTAEAEATPVKTGLAVDKSKLEKGKYELDLKKFQRTTCEMFLKYYEDKIAKEIAANPNTSKDNKLDLLAKRFWGDMPAGIGPDLDS